MSSRHFYALPEAPAAARAEGPGAFNRGLRKRLLLAGSRPERELGVGTRARLRAPFPPESAAPLLSRNSEGCLSGLNTGGVWRRWAPHWSEPVEHVGRACPPQGRGLPPSSAQPGCPRGAWPGNITIPSTEAQRSAYDSSPSSGFEGPQEWGWWALSPGPARHGCSRPLPPAPLPKSECAGKECLPHL